MVLPKINLRALSTVALLVLGLGYATACAPSSNPSSPTPTATEVPTATPSLLASPSPTVPEAATPTPFAGVADPPSAPTGSPANTADGAAKPVAPQRKPSRNLNDLLRDIGLANPTFGGMRLCEPTPPDLDSDVPTSPLCVFVTDAAATNVASLEASIKAILGDDFIPPAGIRIVPMARYTMAQLYDWYSQMRNVIWQIPGIAGTDLDEDKNRLEIRFTPRKGTRALVEAALDRLGIPREAVIIESGCRGNRQEPRSQPDEGLRQALRISVEVPPEVRSGETVPLKLRVKNISNRSVELGLTGRQDMGYLGSTDFVVSSSDGGKVWDWSCGKTVLAVLSHKTLKPGEELEFKGEWEQVDYESDSIPPGTYWVSGVLSVLMETEGFRQGQQKLETEPQPLVILP